MVVVACAAPYDALGLGKHFAQVVEEARDQGLLTRYYGATVRAGDPAGHAIRVPGLDWLLAYTPVRFSPGWSTYLGGDLFDRAVATRLKRDAAFHGFSYHSWHSLQAAVARGCGELLLESASVHVQRVRRQQEQAVRSCGLEAGWLNGALQRKTLREYALADRIYLASTLAYESFLDTGMPAERLAMRRLQVDPRFVPPLARPDDGVFRVLYVGALTAMKGVPLLVEAFSRLTGQVELTLVGGWTTRAMRRYLEAWIARDPRIRIAPGDPLPHLQRADAFVHPSFTDGFGYAPMEALACGVPVIVTNETGMQEHVQEGVNGYVVPAGSGEAILERLAHLQARAS